MVCDETVLPDSNILFHSPASDQRSPRGEDTGIDRDKVARRPVKPFGVGASPTLAASLRPSGFGSARHFSGCDVSSRRLPSEGGGRGCITIREANVVTWGNQFVRLGKPIPATLTIF